MKAVKNLILTIISNLILSKWINNNVSKQDNFEFKEQLPGGDKYNDQLVRIVFYSSSNDNEMNIDQSMTLMLSGHNWRGYPSVVIVAYKKGGRSIDRLAYRIAPEVNNIFFSIMI
jgi:hypothetical protein